MAEAVAAAAAAAAAVAIFVVLANCGSGDRVMEVAGRVLFRFLCFVFSFFKGNRYNINFEPYPTHPTPKSESLKPFLFAWGIGFNVSPIGSAMEKQQMQPPGEGGATARKKKMKKMPSPQELVTHYEKQGMTTQEASLKVIGDLQGALFRTIAANSKRGGDNSNSNSNSSPQVISAKLDAVHSRLVQLETKMDSKPSYPQALAIGVASASIWNGAVELWNTVRRVTSSGTP